MTEMVRYYYIINPVVADRYFNGHRYLTAYFEKPDDDGHFHKIVRSSPALSHRILALSDRAIRCDSRGCRYIKHRTSANLQIPLDPDEFTLIKLSSVEI